MPIMTNWYEARVRYPDGNWSSWQTGQSGGWVFTEPGDYVIEGCVHVVQDFGGYSNYYMYSSSYVPFVVLPQPVPLTNVSVTGNITLYRDMTGFWGATLTDGIAPFTYNWQIKYVDEELLLSNNPLNSNVEHTGGGIIIDGPPTNSWLPIGYNAPIFSKTNNGIDFNDFLLRCIVSDSVNTTITSNEFYVYVVPEYFQDGMLKKLSFAEGKLSESTETISSTNLTDYSLNQNYPNPFNPTTTIEYNLPKEGFVSLKVYDILGKEIVSLVNESQSKGKHSIVLDASHLASGLYFYQIQSNEFSFIRKMILTK